MLSKGSYGQAVLAKVRAELASLDKEGVLATGNALSSVLLLKGEAGPAEKRSPQADAGLLCGPDGTALRKALAALGYAPEDWAGLACWDAQGKPLGSKLLRRAITTIDPATLIVCDATASAAVRDAYAEEFLTMGDIEDALFAEGRVVRVAGMRALALGGFEEALADPRAKQVMWARLKLVPPLAEPY